MGMMVSPFALAAGSPPISYPYNLTITNPDAETGNTTGWTVSGGFTVTSNVGGGYPGPHAGTYYFYGSASGSVTTSYQDIAIPSGAYADVDAGNLAAELSAYHVSADGDYGTFTLECRDVSNSVLASFTAFNTARSSWNLRKAKVVIPANTRTLRIGTSNTRVAGVSSVDSYWDDFALKLTTVKTSYANTGGTGNRTGIITSSVTGIGGGGGSVSGLVNGSLDNNYWWAGATGAGASYITWDFGSSKIIDGFRWYQSTSDGHGTWRLEGSPDNSTWTQIGSDFTLGGANNSEYNFTNTTGYRYYRLRHMSGGRSGNPWLYETEFQIAA